MKKLIRLHVTCHKCAHKGNIDLTPTWLFKMLLVSIFGRAEYEA